MILILFMQQNSIHTVCGKVTGCENCAVAVDDGSTEEAYDAKDVRFG